MSTESYAIEIEFPDLEGYAAGNRGIPYVYSFDSGRPGLHVMVNSLTHGNEVCGAIVVKQLLDLGIAPRCGRLTLSFANVDAYRRFDPKRPDASRFVEQDFNRVWMPAVLDDAARNSVELGRARALRPLIDSVDLLLDLHSMHERSMPLLLSGPLDKGIEFARRVGAPPTIISDEGHPEGRRMRDYGGFGSTESHKNALLVECGQHWDAASLGVARNCTARFLTTAGTLEAQDLPSSWFMSSTQATRVIRVTDAVVARSMDFRFADAYRGLETFAAAGTVIGWNDGEPVVTPYPDCVLVMPSLRQLRPGVTVVRFGRVLS